MVRVVVHPLIDVTFGGLVLIPVYFVPTIVALGRELPRKRPVVLVNVLLGWTVFGWFAALFMACRRAQGVA